MSTDFTHAVMGVGFTPATEPLLMCLPEMVSMGVEEFTLVHVLDVHYPRAPDTEHIPHYEERLRKIAARLEADGLRAHTEVRIGDPASELLAAAGERGACLVVAGSHGEGVFGEALLGSVTSALIQRSTLPVLILPLEVFEDEGAQQCRVVRTDLCAHILHPTDFSDVAERAYAYLAEIASCAGRVTVLHAQDDSRATREQRANVEEYDRLDRARLARLQADLRDRGAAEVGVRLEHGKPGAVIVEITDEIGASLIVLGSQGRGYLSEVMLGSASRHVVRHAHAPVLLVPAPR